MKNWKSRLGALAMAAAAFSAGTQVPREAPWHQAAVISVYDGDTFTAGIDLGFNCTVVEDFRLEGIDTPELKGETRVAGELARDYVKAQIEGRTVEVQAHGQEKYGRWLARVRVNGRDLTDDLISRGLGVPYWGGAKE